MKKILFFILLSIPLFGQELNFIAGDTVIISKLRLGTIASGYDVNLYRDSSNQLKTDDAFEANSYKIGDIEVLSSGRELKNVVFSAGTKIREFQDSKIWIRDDQIEEYTTNSTANLNLNYAGYNHGTTQFRNLNVGNGKGSIIFSITGSTGLVTLDDVTGDIATFNSATIGNLTTNGIISSYVGSDIDIRPYTGRAVGFNYNNSGTWADVIFYNGTSVIASVQETGAIYSASTINSVSGYQLNGSPLTITDLDADLTNFPSQSGNSGKYLTTNGTALSWGTVTVANDTANMATKATTQVLSGEKYFTNTVHFSGDILSTYIIRNPSESLDLRAGNGTTGYDITVGYGTGYGGNFVNYGGTTAAKFISYANGNAYIAGDLTIADDLNVDSVAGYKMWMDKATINDATVSNINATGAYKVSGANLNFSHLAGAVAISQINATGTPSSSTYLRGDGTWSTGSGGGGSGTVTSVDVSVSSPFTSSGGPITSAGTITLGLLSGYQIPTTTNVSNWNTAYNWGNHASAGYLTSEVDGSTTNEIQTLGTSGNNITLTSGGSVTAPYATSAGSVAWSGVTSKPTTLSGYGITDGISSSNTYYGSVTGTSYWVSSDDGILPDVNLVAFPVYINGTLHYLLAY
jgi:hypothetical protein